MASKRKVLTLEDRVAVVKRLNEGISVRSIAKEFDCGKTQISRISEQKEAIMKQWEEGENLERKYVKRRKTANKDLNNRVWDWFCVQRARNMPISGPALQVGIFQALNMI